MLIYISTRQVEEEGQQVPFGKGCPSCLLPFSLPTLPFLSASSQSGRACFDSSMFALVSGAESWVCVSGTLHSSWGRPCIATSVGDMSCEETKRLIGPDRGKAEQIKEKWVFRQPKGAPASHTVHPPPSCWRWLSKTQLSSCLTSLLNPLSSDCYSISFQMPGCKPKLDCLHPLEN